MYKEQKTFTAKIWFPHYNALDQHRVNVIQEKKIKLGCNKSISHASDHVYTDGTIQTTPVKGMFVRPNKTYYDHTSVSNFETKYLKSHNTSYLGMNGYFDLNKKRMITGIKVECVSNVNSEILKPSIYLERSITSPTSITDYQTRTNAFRTNPGGFAGFNFTIGNQKTVKTTSDLKGNPHLFPVETFHHSEYPFETNDLQIYVPIYYDFILIPNFDWFKGVNSAYVMENGKQAMTVIKPYYEYNVDVTYIYL